jgi:hypothetical protein
MGFKAESRRLAISDIKPLKTVAASVKKTPKYGQIVASTGQVGIVELPVVAAGSLISAGSICFWTAICALKR